MLTTDRHTFFSDHPAEPPAGLFKVYRFHEYRQCPSHVPIGRIWEWREFVFVGDPRRRFGDVRWLPRYDSRLLYLNTYGGLTPEEIYLAYLSAESGHKNTVELQAEFLEQFCADARERAIEFVRKLAR